MRFVPYHLLGEQPNIIVDGAGNPYTKITLSHWPHSGTPHELKDDLSAQIVFRYLERPDLHVSVEVASNNHFDEDGLIGLYALLQPEAALPQKKRLIDVAGAGDFGTFRDVQSARVAFVLAAFSDSERSPLSTAIFDNSYPEVAGSLYEELLPRLPHIMDHLDEYSKLWELEDAQLAESQRALAAGRIAIEEIPDIDLAIVTVREQSVPVHAMALHNATQRLRLLIMDGSRYELKFRYETWVQYVSWRPLPRVDLAPLASHLSAMDSAAWIFDGVDAIVPRLHMIQEQAESNIEPDEFRRQIESFLRKAAPAWDPYDTH